MKYHYVFISLTNKSVGKRKWCIGCKKNIRELNLATDIGKQVIVFK